MARILRCGSCGKKFRPENGAVGQEVECPKCSARFAVAEKHYPPYDAFISHTGADQAEAEAVCTALEANGLRCWMAARDLKVASSFPKALDDAIDQSSTVVLVFSSRTNVSDYVVTEISLAVERANPIICFRIEDVQPKGDLKFLLHTRQRRDALASQRDNDRALLARDIEVLVRGTPDTPRSPPAKRHTTLERDMPEFERRARALVVNEFACDRLLRARRAIQAVASLFDGNWERGRHTLVGRDVMPIIVPPDERETTPLALDILETIRDNLKESRNDPCNIESDEGGLIQESRNARYTWVIDPIDGSRHLMRHLPFFTTTMTLVDRQYRGILAMVYVPVTGELFFTARGRGLGAYLNNWDTRLKVSKRKPEEAYAYVEFPNVDTPKREFTANCRSLNDIFKRVYRVRGCGLGSLGMAYVAKGAFDAYLTLSGKTRRCDVLAGAMLVEKAGGRAQIVDAHPPKKDRPASLGEVYAMGANRKLHDDLTEIDGISNLFERKRNSR